MEFERLKNGSVKCIISQEEIQENGLTIADFINDRNKVHDFLGVVIEKAKEEVDYVNESGIVALKVVPLSNNRLAIIFSEESEENLIKELSQGLGSFDDEDECSLDDFYDEYDDGEPLEFSEDEQSIIDAFEKDPFGLLEKLERHVTSKDNELKKLNGEVLEACDRMDGCNADKKREALLKKINSNTAKELYDLYLKTDEKDEPALYYTRKTQLSDLNKKIRVPDPCYETHMLAKVLKFKDLDNVISFTRFLDGIEKISSKLYKNEENDEYFLVFKIGSLDDIQFEQLGFRIQEYADKTYGDMMSKAYIEEHYKCLINSNALVKLRELL